jgi:small Trp-rich protein
MWFVVIGTLIIVSNLANIGPFAGWNWQITGDLWKFCVPFGFAVLWWVWTDRSGMDKRREMDKMQAKKEARRRDNLVALGMDVKSNKRRGGRR